MFPQNYCIYYTDTHAVLYFRMDEEYALQVRREQREELRMFDESVDRREVVADWDEDTQIWEGNSRSFSPVNLPVRTYSPVHETNINSAPRKRWSKKQSKIIFLRRKVKTFMKKTLVY